MLFHLYGQYGLFARPELAGERVSYPVPPFSALEGVLRNFYYKQGAVWTINRVYLLRPIKFLQIMRNERGFDNKITQRRSLFLSTPDYVIDASISGEDVGKYQAMASRWISHGRRRLPIFLGVRECMGFLEPPPADFLERARATMRRMGTLPRLGSMPYRVSYTPWGQPIKWDMRDYAFSADGYYEVCS